MKAIKMKVKGLKCDNPKCNFKDDSISVKDYKNWVNKKCPKCGSILLTEKDYNAILIMQGFINLTNNIISAEGKSHLADIEPKAVVKCEMNGTGNIKFGKPEIIK